MAGFGLTIISKSKLAGTLGPSDTERVNTSAVVFDPSWTYRIYPAEICARVKLVMGSFGAVANARRPFAGASTIWNNNVAFGLSASVASRSVVVITTESPSFTIAVKSPDGSGTALLTPGTLPGEPTSCPLLPPAAELRYAPSFPATLRAQLADREVSAVTSMR